MLKLRHILPLALLMLCACSKEETTANADYQQADSLIHDAYKMKDYPLLIQYADTYEQMGVLSDVEANYWRGYACSRMKQMRRAEIFWKAAVASDVRTDVTKKYYAKSANRLSNLLLLKGDYDGTLRVALPAIDKLGAIGGDSIGDFANLLTTVACCQLNLNMTQEAEANFNRSFVDYQVMIQRHYGDNYYKSAAVSLITTTTSYLAKKNFDMAYQWTERFASLLTRYRERGDIDSVFLDKEIARLYIYKATALQGMDSIDKATHAYKEAMATNYAKTGDGKIEACEYLMAANRWQEAAKNYELLDAQMAQYNMELSLDNLMLYLLPKFRANAGAHRNDSSIAVAMKICNALDSAVIEQKKSDVAELATIYDTQKKEAQIVKQRIDMTRQRFIYTAIALILVIAFFGIYTFHKRRAQHRLAVAHSELEQAHSQLQKAYDKLETTTKAKERIESELRIARNIQLSIVPNVFPRYKGLDLYASMTPAREVGGDLYDFILQDDSLYICVGDVSGKGVPAALFMAQAARMFRALAKEGLLPADIATRLNEELTENNDNGMFVTMFLGLVDLKTGRLQFCNAGHNPPVLGNDFMKMEANQPVGLWAEAEFVGEEIESIKNTPMFIYTDGLNEAENVEQEQFGDERLLKILTDTHFYNAQQAIQRLDMEIQKHRAGCEPNDDLTMLCLMVK